MIYILSDDRYEYVVYDARTNSIVSLLEDELNKLLSIEGNYLVNGYIENGKIKRNKFLADELLGKTDAYLVLSKVGKSDYAVIGIYKWFRRYTRTTLHTEISIINSKDLKKLINKGVCLNSKYERGKIVSEYTIETREDFIAEIKEEYKKYSRKLKVLGINYKINYAILGEEVILNHMSSVNNSSNILIPNFITSIASGALYICDCEVGIGKNVRALGVRFLETNAETEVNIPSTVDYMYAESIVTIDLNDAINKGKQCKRRNIDTRTKIIDGGFILE